MKKRSLWRLRRIRFLILKQLQGLARLAGRVRLLEPARLAGVTSKRKQKKLRRRKRN